MARRYNWEKLKSKYLAGLYRDLKEFAEKEKINYQVVRNNSKGWNEERLQYRDIKVTKITQRTIDKIIETESDRNARYLAISDMVLETIEEYFKSESYRKHLVNLKSYNYGKLVKEELITKELDVPDTRALSNVVSSLEKVQKGQRLALGMDLPAQHDITTQTNEHIIRLADLLNKPVADRPVENFEDEE